MTRATAVETGHFEAGRNECGQTTSTTFGQMAQTGQSLADVAQQSPTSASATSTWTFGGSKDSK